MLKSARSFPAETEISGVSKIICKPDTMVSISVLAAGFSQMLFPA